MNNLEAFDSVTADLRAMYERKNKDYGDSFNESLDEDGLIAFKVRAGDKWLRIKQLLKTGKAEIKSESIRDTIEDLANYCIMAVMWLEEQKKCKQSI